CCSFQKADAKVRTLKHIFQIFSEVFFFIFFLFPVFSNPLNKDKKSKTRKVLFLCESDCKDKENY
ncbi:hypothetical protein, partial [Bacteroides uniformis]|uniref:hypothetical protein n=1 Tax=Bacteroides uniformis TaxID=820 RepID=UPI00125D3A59